VMVYDVSSRLGCVPFGIPAVVRPEGE